VSPREDELRLIDIADALTAIERHLKRGSIDDELVFDACRVRLIEIGEAVKGLDPGLLELEPDVPWREVARMRDQLTHRYFDTQHEIVKDVVENDLRPLRAAVGAIRARLEAADPGQTGARSRRNWLVSSVIESAAHPKARCPGRRGHGGPASRPTAFVAKQSSGRVSRPRSLRC
jgi:uncharacterized protein with HEPN domain